MQKILLEKKIKELVKKETRGKYNISFYTSKRTDSLYFKLERTGTNITLRFSDHPNESNLPFCDTTNFNKKRIVEYIHRRIYHLEKKKINTLLQAV